MSVTAFLSRIIIVAAVINTAVFLPSLGGVKFNCLTTLSKFFTYVSSNAFFLMEKAALTIATYCSEDLGKHLETFVHYFAVMGKSFSQYISTGKMFGHIGDALVAVHKNGMSYTEDILIQLLGAQGRLLHDDGNSARNKLISLVLFVIWLIMGLIFISRLSYNKFFILMAGTFLLHAIFGPVWCLHQLAFVTGFCLWVGSLIANKPIPAALAVLLLFGTTGFRKWRTQSAQARSQTELLQSNKSIEQRIENIERKLDIVLEKINMLAKKNQ